VTLTLSRYFGIPAIREKHRRVLVSKIVESEKLVRVYEEFRYD
jgi:hypothetical protein